LFAVQNKKESPKRFVCGDDWVGDGNAQNPNNSEGWEPSLGDGNARTPITVRVGNHALETGMPRTPITVMVGNRALETGMSKTPITVRVGNRALETGIGFPSGTPNNSGGWEPCLGDGNRVPVRNSQ